MIKLKELLKEFNIHDYIEWIKDPEYPDKQKMIFQRKIIGMVRTTLTSILKKQGMKKVKSHSYETPQGRRERQVTGDLELKSGFNEIRIVARGDIDKSEVTKLLNKKYGIKAKEDEWFNGNTVEVKKIMEKYFKLEWLT